MATSQKDIAKKKRATVSLDPSLHQALREKALDTGRTITEIVDDAARYALDEDEEDISVSKARANGIDIPLEDLVGEMKARGKL